MAHINHFDFIAPYYDRFVKPTDVERFSRLAGLPVDGLLLDVGGGTGQKSHQLLEQVGGLVIADSSRGMLSQARLKPGMRPVEAEGERLPFKNGMFARVIMVDALHHVRDHCLTLAELWRVVKPGGRIVIEEPDIHTASAKKMAVFEKLVLMRSHFLSPEAIRDGFRYPNARTRIVSKDSTSWIIVDKLAVTG